LIESLGRPSADGRLPLRLTRNSGSCVLASDTTSGWYPRAVVGDVHAVFALPRGLRQRAVGVDDGLLHRVATGRLKEEAQIQQAFGRLRERYPRVARYYAIAYDAEHRQLVWRVHEDKKAVATKLDGSYLLKTDRHDLPAEDIWRTYILLTRVEHAFRAMKSPLMERPIFHHLEHRTQTHIFLCVLAYHLLTAIEHRFLQAGIHTSWWTLRQQLSTHRVATIVLPTPPGPVLNIRKATTPEPVHRDIYATLRIPAEVMKPMKTWHPPDHSDANTP
jgi:hypothetical protein